MRSTPVRQAATLGAALLLFGACVWIAGRVDVEPVDPARGVEVATPVKAHLKDGSTVVFPNGIVVAGAVIRGEGHLYSLELKDLGPVKSVELDEVLGLETFKQGANEVETLLVSAAATTATLVGGSYLYVAIFGSCPTVYSEGPGRERLEAETFSNSIAPLLEARDVDRLVARPRRDGTLRLEIRNEALETHSLNHLQLLEAVHDPGETVAPDPRGQVLVLRDVRAFETARDRSGRDVGEVLRAADGRAFSSDPRRIDAATTADLEDWIDLSAPVPEGAPSAALVLRQRNSLLKTVFFYDEMLGAAGAKALEWVGGGLEQMATAAAVGRWQRGRTGLHVWVWGDGAYREVVRAPDPGPIAWNDVAIPILVPRGERTLRLRLRFVVDHWRIDRAALAWSARRVEPRAVPLADVAGAQGAPEQEALEGLRAADTRYLKTGPGQRFVARFDVGPDPAGKERTFLLSSQGYYTEWVRPAWVRAAQPPRPFVPSDATLLAVLRRWRHIQADFERRFYATRIPVA